jgi:pimeloyl-ACP methyl ester carboxylesterase
MNLPPASTAPSSPAPAPSGGERSRPPATPDRARARRLLARAWRAVALAVLVVAAVVLASSATNAVLNAAERATTPAYGERIAVEGGSLNVYRHGDTGPTIVMLGGYSTPAPALDFAPLIRELDGYQVVVVEGFGYGYADTDAPPRTIENITEELHDALAEVGVETPYALLGHSIGGIYSLYYANQYRSEVSAVIGIDASVPGQVNGLAGQGSPLLRLVSTSGLLRAATVLAPALVEPDGTAHTSDERRRMRLMQNWNYANPALSDEAEQAARNFAVVDDLTYPDDLPVLSFIKSSGSQERWRELHERQLQNLTDGELVVLDGGHYLHWTHAVELGEKIRQFLGSDRTAG